MIVGVYYTACADECVCLKVTQGIQKFVEDVRTHEGVPACNLEVQFSYKPNSEFNTQSVGFESWVIPLKIRLHVNPSPRRRRSSSYLLFNNSMYTSLYARRVVCNIYIIIVFIHACIDNCIHSICICVSACAIYHSENHATSSTEKNTLQLHTQLTNTLNGILAKSQETYHLPPPTHDSITYLYVIVCMCPIVCKYACIPLYIMCVHIHHMHVFHCV